MLVAQLRGLSETSSGAVVMPYLLTFRTHENGLTVTK